MSGNEFAFIARIPLVGPLYAESLHILSAWADALNIVEFEDTLSTEVDAIVPRQVEDLEPAAEVTALKAA